MKEDQIFWTWHSNESVTLRKHVSKYKHIRKCMVEFFSKCEGSRSKIDRVDPISITKLLFYFNFLCAVPLGDVMKRTRFLMSSPVIQYTLVSGIFLGGTANSKFYSIKHTSFLITLECCLMWPVFCTIRLQNSSDSCLIINLLYICKFLHYV